MSSSQSLSKNWTKRMSVKPAFPSKLFASADSVRKKIKIASNHAGPFLKVVAKDLLFVSPLQPWSSWSICKCWDSTKEMNNVLRAQRSVDMGSWGGDREGVGQQWHLSSMAARPRPYFFLTVFPQQLPHLCSSLRVVCVVLVPILSLIASVSKNSREIQKSWDIVILFPSQIKKQSS